MKKIIGLLIAVLCAVVLGGCGSDNAPGNRSAGAADTSPAASTSATTPPDRVASVLLRRSGGLKPIPVTRVFTAGEAPPKGYTAADLARVLRAAQALVDAHQKIRPLPAITCCDRYLYSVSIVLADGTTRSYSAVDGVNQPRIFKVLLSRLS
jgi:hypothetical protein